MTCSTKHRRGTQVAQGSARAAHNTGPLGTGSQYRITSWGRMRGWETYTQRLPQPQVSLQLSHLYHEHHQQILSMWRVLGGVPRM